MQKRVRERKRKEVNGVQATCIEVKGKKSKRDNKI